MRKCFLTTITAMILATGSRAEKAVVLESFESGISAVTLRTNTGGRPLLTPPGVSLSQRVRESSGDSTVTEGNKSLQVVLRGRQKYSADFKVTLSESASDQIRKAMRSTDEARYLLRYDVIFPPLRDFAYFNSVLRFGDNRDVLISSGGKRTMSIALDLLTGLPDKGPLTLEFADDFELKGEFSSVTFYLDNIRLVDSYVDGAKPVVYVLQSFENSSAPTGNASAFTEWDGDKPIKRTQFSQYTASSTQDVRVTEGAHALQVVNADPAAWHADFSICFQDTKLAEVLKLDRDPESRPTAEQLSRYTLRWDVTFPDMTNEWMNCTYHTMQTFLPVIQVRQDKPMNQRLTYSVTLDQTEWGNWMEKYPTLVFITEGPQQSKGTRVYYDNFRLIDTGNVPSAEAKGTVRASADKPSH